MSSSNSGLPGNTGFKGNPGNPNNPGLGRGIQGGPKSTHQTHVQVIHDDGSLSNTIRSLFIYGTGGARM
jgi:hypothetical protein